MLNQVVLVGRIAKEVEVEEKNCRKVSTLTITVPRSFKNMNGEYENDIIDCIMYEYNIAKNVMEYCKKGDIVGIKGRLQNIDGKTLVIGEKITFLSSRPKNESEDE